ncbi:hypothetical protein VP01_1877g9 [Puccinia sorghi]|uniref:Uncharacterized protein n=1 Tax=Puccinia sorghi TaxID=27349 RepID=A0A0L6VDN4_9BASI|nr:hypothetical protein VP01_1877g9 [Puccinia sorghi]
MHIKCFCHKMALVVNAGLKKLGLEAPQEGFSWRCLIMNLILMILMKEKRIFLKKTMMTRMEMIP